MTAAHLSSAAAVVAALTANAPAQSDAGPRAKSSLCLPSETVLFSCTLAAKTVSVCGQPERGRAVYRFGRRGHIELETANLQYTSTGFSGGGEEQIVAETSSHRYVVYTGGYRTAFGSDGHFDTRFESGLLVLRGHTIISGQVCRADALIDKLTLTLMPAGEFVRHQPFFARKLR